MSGWGVKLLTAGISCWPSLRSWSAAPQAGTRSSIVVAQMGTWGQFAVSLDLGNAPQRYLPITWSRFGRNMAKKPMQGHVRITLHLQMGAASISMWDIEEILLLVLAFWISHPWYQFTLLSEIGVIFKYRSSVWHSLHFAFILSLNLWGDMEDNSEEENLALSIPSFLM